MAGSVGGLVVLAAAAMTALTAACAETPEDFTGPATAIWPGSAELLVGDVVQLSVSGAEDAISWGSSNTSVATVDFGAVEGIGAGTAMITARTGRDTLFASVTVSERPSALVTLSGDVQPIFAARCIGCHSGTNPSGALNLSSVDQSYAMLVGQTSRVNAARGLLVAVGDSTNSYLYQTVARKPANASQWMPPNCSANCLTDVQVRLIGTWIQQGAHKSP
ncbi:MAG TPA: hypothetical protein VMM18_00580 [Gemmatimonadaceae bacterium]|nr:hypothetical protein [Gemmatimonadaceae bacterium]